jgi:hypothetical protein
MSKILCPHCQQPLPRTTVLEVLQAEGRRYSKRKTEHKGGRPLSDGPRCPCGEMTLARAKARGHKCHA